MSAVAAPVEAQEATPATPAKPQLAKPGRLMRVPLSKVREAQLAIRKTVDKESDKYKGLRDSIRKDGIINPPNAREEVDPLSPTEKIYVLIDGLQRTTAARECGYPDIPLYVLDVDPVRAMELQFVGNLQRIDMPPAQYSKALVDYIAHNPTISKMELANTLSVSESWLEDRLSLANLHKDLHSLVDDGIIKVVNAVSLAKLPEDRQVAFKEAAIGKDAATFASLVRAERTAINKAKKEGAPEGPPQFEAKAKFRKMTEIEAEIEQPQSLKAAVMDSGLSNPMDVALLAVKWAINMDPTSLKVAKEAFDAHQLKKEEEAKARKAEAQKKKEAKEAAKATEVATAA